MFSMIVLLCVGIGYLVSWLLADEEEPTEASGERVKISDRWKG